MNSDLAELCGRVPSARRLDDGVDDATDAVLRLSTAMILPRWNMVEGAPHTAKRSMINCCVYGVPPAHIYKGWREEEAGPHRARPSVEFY